MHAESEDRLRLSGLAAFSLPVVIVITIEIAWRVYLPGFFTKTLGLSLGEAGALLMAARLFDSLVDPVIAWASDRIPTPFGHRRPWLVASVPLLMVGAGGVFIAAPWIGGAGLIASALLLHLGYMMLVTPHGGWALEMARDPAERVRIMGAKTWFGVAGMIAVLLLPAGLEQGFGLGQAGQVAALGLVLMLLCPLSVFLIMRLVAEPVLSNTRAAELANPLRLFAGILRTAALRPILLLYLATGLADAATSALFLFLVQDGLHLQGWGSTLLLLQSAPALLLLPLWSKLAVRMGRRPMLMIVYGWQMAIAPLALLLPDGRLGPVIGFLLLRGLFAGVDYTLLRSMVSDVARDAAATGLRYGASCYSISNITLKLAMGAGAWGALSVLASGSAAHGGMAGDSVGNAMQLRAIFALAPLIAGTLGLLVLLSGPSRTACRTDTPGRAITPRLPA